MMKYYSALKKKEILFFVTTWMYPEDNVLCGSKPYIERQTYNLTYMWNLTSSNLRLHRIEWVIAVFLIHSTVTIPNHTPLYT